MLRIILKPALILATCFLLSSCSLLNQKENESEKQEPKLSKAEVISKAAQSMRDLQNFTLVLEMVNKSNVESKIDPSKSGYKQNNIDIKVTYKNAYEYHFQGRQRDNTPKHSGYDCYVQNNMSYYKDLNMEKAFNKEMRAIPFEECSKTKRPITYFTLADAVYKLVGREDKVQMDENSDTYVLTYSSTDSQQIIQDFSDLENQNLQIYNPFGKSLDLKVIVDKKTLRPRKIELKIQTYYENQERIVNAEFIRNATFTEGAKVEVPIEAQNGIPKDDGYNPTVPNNPQNPNTNIPIQPKI